MWFYILGDKPYLSSESFKDIYDELLNNGLHQTVLLTMSFVIRTHEAKDGELYSEFSEVIIALQAAGKDVILVGDVPFYTVEPYECIYNTHKEIEHLCNMDLDTANAQQSVYIDILKKLGKDLNVAVLDIYDPLCDDKGCSMIKGDYVLYRDKHHLNIRGSQLVGEYIVDKLFRSRK